MAQLIDRANIKDKGQLACCCSSTTRQPGWPPRRLSSTEQKSGIDYFMTLKRSPSPLPSCHLPHCAKSTNIADKVKFHDPQPKRGPGRVLTVSRGAAVGYSVTLSSPSSYYPSLSPTVPRIFTRPLSLMLSVVVMMHPLLLLLVVLPAAMLYLFAQNRNAPKERCQCQSGLLQ